MMFRRDIILTIDCPIFQYSPKQPPEPFSARDYSNRADLIIFIFASAEGIRAPSRNENQGCLIACLESTPGDKQSANI